MGELDEVDEELSARISALYELDPDEFVAAREATVKALRADKRRDDASLIHGLAKPTVVAWAANRAVAAGPELLDRLEQAGAGLVDAQQRAIEEGDASALRPAQAERRAATTALVDAAEAVLGRRDRSTNVRRDELSALFDAVSLDPEAATELRAGRLARPPAGPPAFDPFSAAAAPAGSRTAPSRSSSRRPPPTSAKRAGRARSQAGQDSAAEQAEEAAEAEERAAEERRRADQALSAAQQAHEQALRRADAAHRRREEASAALSEASRAVEDLEAQLARAREERERASAEAERAGETAADADELVEQATEACERAERAVRDLS
jgi:hypothetical protein